MPKRTNEFQNLIKFIYERITPVGGIITESGMVFDKDAKDFREVDILIEQILSGHSIKIAIECRDRSRKATVEWVDCLIGKSVSLDVNKMVAVSKKGFTKTALNKASSHGIDTLTFEEANEKDWENYFFKPGLVVSTPEIFTLKNVLYLSNNKYINLSQLGMDSKVEYNEEIIGTIKSVIEGLFREFLAPHLAEYVNDNRLEIFKTYADLKKIMRIEKEQQIPKIIVLSDNRKPVEISKIKFVMLGTREIKDVQQTHTMFNNKMLSVGEHLENDGSTIKFKLLQDPETKNLHINWKRE